MDAMLFAVTFAVSALGFAAIAFAQKQHRPLLPYAASVPPPAWLRLTGCIFLGVAGTLAVYLHGLAFGLLLWTGILTLSALAVIVCLTRLTKRRTG